MSLCKFRILNSENKTCSELIIKAINHPNLLEENIKKEISKDLSSKYELINKINDKLYDDNSKEKSLESIRRICNKEDLNNKAKIERRKRININNNLENPKIKEITRKEKRINIVLDNARIHTAKMIQKAAEILNINLIFLRPYCPDLNPIEDLWKIIKSVHYSRDYADLDELMWIVTEEFYKHVTSSSLYEGWIDEFIRN